jgi:hypothetical protein
MWGWKILWRRDSDKLYIMYDYEWMEYTYNEYDIEYI